MVGYSRLMEADESGAAARLKAHRNELIDPVIAENSGRIIKTTGDGMLVEFASVVDAVTCAAEIQRRMARRNTDLLDDRCIDFRLGVNLGDVIIDGDDIQGAGVNIAVRLEGLAQPGGVCVSRTVVEHVKDKLDLEFEALGPQKVKNIAEPVSAFRLVPGADATPAKTPTSARKWRMPAIAAAVFVVLIAGGG